MGKTGKQAVLLTLVAVVIVLTFTATALARTVTNVQLTPGVTTRTIVDKTQVAVYKLPIGVTHRGMMHFELQWKHPNWADFDLYLLNSDGVSLAEPQGYAATFTGREYVDYQVRNISNQTIESDPYSGDYMVGDTYYLVVVAFNERAEFKLSGYYPQVDFDYGLGWDTTNAWNVYWQSFSKPWTWLSGPSYGYPFNFTPTSEGTATVQLDFPVDPATGTPITSPPFASNWESYIYAGRNWDAVIEDYGHNSNYVSPLVDPFAVTEGQTPTAGAAPPMLVEHFIPTLYLPSSTTDPVGTPLPPDYTSTAAPRLGKTTLAYKGTLTYPENLTMTGVSWVRRGSPLVLKGTYALNSAWAPVGTKVTVKMKTTTGWKAVKAVKVGANGKWKATVYPKTTATWQASAPGDDSTGLAVELSAAKRIFVRR
jgi:hypothetical protein